ncbi:MAG: glycoside hydrolase family 9 protein [Prolixibacteraceae bacterium]|nr:glycoside hydrolase family 9 protein [Prolixibacteraceae bacterium]
MVKFFGTWITMICLLSNAVAVDVIRINQMGYLPQARKIAVFISDRHVALKKFKLIDNLTGKGLFEGVPLPVDGTVWGQKSAYRFDFSSVVQQGGYHLEAADAISPNFSISTEVYKGSADYILTYLRQQRCGFNPSLKDSCHTADGIVVDHPDKSGKWIDVTGGWHDASDYLQYTLTSANAVYQMLFAYRENPSAYRDNFRANGLPGSNGIPDILDEARWGLDWLLKMNPGKGEMYYQIADDRDHRGYRLPTLDTVSYGLGKKFRPVYFATGKPQGSGKHRNRTTGVASVATKFCSSFAMGSEIFDRFDPALAARLRTKASEAWEFANSDPGVCQTACVVSPYFYEEENYTDDMELAAISLSQISHSAEDRNAAAKWGEIEQVTPWMELHRARHYQYYPFVNLGHTFLAQSSDSLTSKKFAGFMKQGLMSLQNFAAGDPFPIGIPFIWCSNNLVVAAATQARLYRKITGDRQFEELEAALTDWLFGCNPWGTSMICGLPLTGDYPVDPHSAITYWMKQPTWGGLVDGPVYKQIFNSLLGITLHRSDSYAAFQGGKAVYHDDNGDYSTNEPTMDGTASLSYLLSSLEASNPENDANIKTIDNQGALVRMNQAEKKIYLIFSAHEFGEGGFAIEKSLKKFGSKGSFFFTGDFYRSRQNSGLISQLLADGHYLGAHSDRHLLYADWNKRDSTLVKRENFEKDLLSNYKEIIGFGIQTGKARFFLPPYEWYNREVVSWAKQLGLTTINFTPNIRTNADYTTPEMPNYRSSEQLMNDLKQFESKDPNGLNGAFILIHLGTAPQRTDKFYLQLDDLQKYLTAKGYQLCSLSDVNP